MRPDIPIIIAAGGDGSRLGGNKPERLLGGTRLIDHALRQARIWSDDVVVALRASTHLALPDEVPVLMDDETNGGPLSALTNALAYGEQQGARYILFLACDMPFLPRDLFARMKAQADGRVAIAKSAGRLHPACSLWPSNAVAHLDGYIATGRRSLLGLAERVGFVEVEWSDNPVDPFFNINSPEDLLLAESLLDQKGPLN